MSERGGSVREGSWGGTATDWRPPVLAAAVWVGSWAGTAAEPWLAGSAAAVAVALVGLGRWRRRWLVVAAGLALLVATAGSGVRGWVASQGPVAVWAREQAVVKAVLRVGGGQLGEGRHGPVWTATATLVELEGRGERWQSGVLVRLSAFGALARSWDLVPTGASVRATVRLSPVEASEPVSAWARARGEAEVVAQPGPLDQAVTAVRAGLRAAVSGLPASPRALVPALVVGDTSGVGNDLKDDFRTTGLTHVMAVSGSNLTLLLAAMLWVAARLGVSGWWRRGVAVVGVIGFVLLCRAEPSVLRAAAMGVVGLAALGWGGTRQGLRYLAWAVVVLLLVDPWLCRSVGFVLSVCASGGIIVWASRWAAQLDWLPRWLAEAVTVPVSAQLATQPVVTAISGQVSLVGVVANLAAAPLVGPGTVLGFVAAALSVVFLPAARVAGWLAGGFAQALAWVAQVGAGLPGAALVWPAGPWALAVLTACCATALVGLPQLWRRPWLAAALAAAMVVSLLRPVSAPGWPPQGWQVVSCDVGQGDATVFWAGDGAAVVVDAGPESAAVDRCLAQLGITEVAWLVVTHLHADHIGGVAGVAAGRRVHNVLYSGVVQPESGWRALESTLATVPRTIAVPGMVVTAGATRLTVLAIRPYAETGAGGEDSADQNDSSIVMRVEVAGVRVLIAGDVEEAGQSHALATAADLSANALLVPHHGSSHQSSDFLAAVGESVAVVSVGADNSYGHPAERTVMTVDDSGAQLYRTDRNGSVAVSRDGEGLRVTTQRPG